MSSSLALFAYNFCVFFSPVLGLKVTRSSKMSKNIPAHSLILVDSINLHDVLHCTLKDIFIFRLQPKKQGTDSPGRHGVVGSAHCPAPPTHTVGGAHHHPVIGQQFRGRKSWKGQQLESFLGGSALPDTVMP